MNNAITRLMQFLFVCYRYNTHTHYRLYINVIGQTQATIVYKQLINYRYVAKLYQTNLTIGEVMDTINEFYKTIPENPEILAIGYDNFNEYVNSLLDYRDIFYIL